MRLLATVCIVLGMPDMSLAQNDFVQWDFKSVPLSRNEYTLVLMAKVNPEWHMYSQFINEGGPVPTTIRLDPSEAFVVVGPTREEGEPVTYYDEIYEMSVTWFTGSVSFYQRIKARHPVTRVTGKIEYMTCNYQRCIPSSRAFTIDLKQ